jgi:hypothetical protein
MVLSFKGLSHVPLDFFCFILRADSIKEENGSADKVKKC